MTLSDLQGNFKIRALYQNVANKPNGIQQQYKTADDDFHAFGRQSQWQRWFVVSGILYVCLHVYLSVSAWGGMTEWSGFQSGGGAVTEFVNIYNL